MVRKMAVILMVIFSASVAFADVEIDTDDNSAVDVDKGGTNRTTLSKNDCIFTV